MRVRSRARESRLHRSGKSAKSDKGAKEPEAGNTFAASVSALNDAARALDKPAVCGDELPSRVAQAGSQLSHKGTVGYLLAHAKSASAAIGELTPLKSKYEMEQEKNRRLEAEVKVLKSLVFDL